MILFDIVNLCFCMLITSILLVKKVIKPWMAYAFILLFFAPLLLNGVLFSADYMPDQFRYYYIARSIRDFNFINHGFSNTVEVSSWIMAFIPVPFVESIQSLGFSNRLLFLFLFVWLYRKQFMPKHLILFLVFYPSLILYTSLTLRDTLVMVFMVVSVVFYIEKKHSYSIIWLIPLIFIKFQNFFIIALYYVFDFFLIRRRLSNFFRYLFIVTFFLVILMYIDDIVKLIDFYRLAMFADDGGDVDTYMPIVSLYDFIYNLITSPIYFILKPLPWEATSVFMLVQSIENIFILFYLSYSYLKVKFINSTIANKWLLFLIVAAGIYGMVVFNFGSAVRYKFPIIVLFITAMYYDAHRARCVKNGCR